MEALTSIVFATVALEAFINELADFPAEFPDSIEPVIATFAGLMQELEKSRASIASKFWLGRWVFASTPYDKGKEPYQSFGLLIELRNALVHSHSLSKLNYDSSTGRFAKTPHEEPLAGPYGISMPQTSPRLSKR